MTGGVRAALEQVLDGAAGAEALEQAGLFDDLDAAEIGDLDAKSPLSKRAEHPLAEAVRATRKGRPPGSRNRRTEATIRWLLAQHRHPLAVMAEGYSMSPADLARAIGIAEPSADVLLDLYKLQLRMAEAVAPYVAQRLPQAVTLQGGVDFTLQVGGVSFPARGASAENSEPVDVPFTVALPPKSDS